MTWADAAAQLQRPQEPGFLRFPVICSLHLNPTPTPRAAAREALSPLLPTPGVPSAWCTRLPC